MKQKTFKNVRLQLKGDTEENLEKASGFVPLDKELVAIKPDENTQYTRLMVGDGATSVNDLSVINPQSNWNQNDPSQPDYIRNRPESFGLSEDDVKKIVGNKVDKITEKTTYDQLYMKDKDGNFKMINLPHPGSAWIPDGIPRYSGGGLISVGDPTFSSAAVNKRYLEANAVLKQTGDGTSNNFYSFVYALDNITGETKKIAAGHMPYGIAWSGGIVQRYGNHILVPSEPLKLGVSTIDNQVATSVFYVDRADKANETKIINNSNKINDNTKRIENLENTLLTYIEDTESAYEKTVPVGVGKNAVLSSIGGATKTSKNLLDPSLFGKPVNKDGSFHLEEDYGEGSAGWFATARITLEPNVYYLSYKVANSVGGGLITNGGFLDENGNITNYIDLNDPTTCEIVIEHEGAGVCSHDIYVMLSTEPDAEFEPYFEGERCGNVTKIESYGSNLFNPQWLIDYVGDYYKNNIEPYGNGVKVSAYPLRTNITFAKFLELTGLKVGDTFTALSTVIDSSTGEKITTGTYNLTFEAGGDGTWLDIIAPNPQYPKKITITEDMLKYQQLNIYMEGAKTTPKYVVDIMLTKTNVLLPYEPFSAEPIDSFTIPSEIQAINGYGKDGFIIDFEEKTATYEGKVTDVSQYLTGYDKFKTLKVQGGGRVRAVTEHKLAVPFEMTYVKAKE